jgi:hypothetical protein
MMNDDDVLLCDAKRANKLLRVYSRLLG